MEINSTFLSHTGQEEDVKKDGRSTGLWSRKLQLQGTGSSFSKNFVTIVQIVCIKIKETKSTYNYQFFKMKRELRKYTLKRCIYSRF